MNEVSFLGKTSFVWWQGVVEDNDDPLKLGRCRVRILGFHSPSKIDIPTEHLPWASTIQPITSAALSGIGSSPTGLLPGSWVVGFFRDGELAQDPIIMGSIAGIPQEKPNPTDGFSDPSGEYPLDDHLEEADTNRLARNENVDKTIVALKTMNVEADVTKALSDVSWDEPVTPYAAEYPKNHVVSTESGHIQEFDDTPNAERIHTYHKSGTFTEIHPDGTTVQKIVGEGYEIIAEDSHVFIKGSKAENIDGNSHLKVGGGVNVHISGNVNILVEGNVTMETRGDFYHKVEGVYAVVSEGNMVFIAPRIDFNPDDTESTDLEDAF